MTDPRTQPLVAIVKANPGADRVVIAAGLAVNVRTIRAATAEAVRLGLIVRVIGKAGRVMFYTPDQMEALRQQCDAAQQERQRLMAERKRRKAEATRKARDAVITAPVVHRWVSAASPLPFRCRAPASVFHLGAML